MEGLAVGVRAAVGGGDARAGGDDATGDHGEGSGLLEVVHFGILLVIAAAGPPQHAMENSGTPGSLRRTGDVHPTV
ncbi:hypothetical protein GCM10017752_54250 [Streptomyces roseoviridis]